MGPASGMLIKVPQPHLASYVVPVSDLEAWETHWTHVHVQMERRMQEKELQQSTQGVISHFPYGKKTNKKLYELKIYIQLWNIAERSYESFTSL